MSDFLDTLTAADITDILANTKKRGQTQETLDTFDKSGEMYVILNTLPQYKGKDKMQLQAIRNQLTIKAKALELGHIRFAKKDDNILMINTSLLAVEDSDESEDES